MASSLRPRGALLASALLLSACALQRAPAMSRRTPDEPARFTSAHAAPAPPDPAEEPVAGSDPVPGSDIVRARASVLVRASAARVRAILFDCPSYPSWLPSYRACTDLGPSPGGGRLWRMDIEELGGLLKLWLRAEVVKVSSADGVEVYEGRYVDGNIKTFSSRWRLEATDRGFTRLSIESHLDPKLPIPSALINSGSVDGIRAAIVAIKQRAEQGGGPAVETDPFAKQPAPAK
ncbi:MAG: SRPBCC family protein [Minicystis sp.]